MFVSNKFLIKKLKRNDHKAFEQLFITYAPKILNFCKKLYLPDSEAEEIVQIVFCAVWENRRKIDENKSFLAYIYTIARNTIANKLKRKAYFKGFVNYSVNNDESYDFVTENQVLFNELNLILQKCLTELPPKRREVFILSRYDGFSYQEIAKKLSISESTVNSQITKTIVHIKNELSQYI